MQESRDFHAKSRDFNEKTRDFHAKTRDLNAKTREFNAKTSDFHAKIEEFEYQIEIFQNKNVPRPLNHNLQAQSSSSTNTFSKQRHALYVHVCERTQNTLRVTDPEITTNQTSSNGMPKRRATWPLSIVTCSMVEHCNVCMYVCMYVWVRSRAPSLNMYVSICICVYVCA
jgi:hypothetical protein